MYVLMLYVQVMKKIAEFNIGQNTSAFSKTGCKNTGFVEAIVLRGAQFHRSSFRLEADRMIFSDGQEFPCDAIIACTGKDDTSSLLPWLWGLHLKSHPFR